jgi:regulator of cell morphogenesis and NO signaling
MHDNIGDKLSDLTNIIIKYLPAEIMPNERIGVWFDLAQLSKDLDKHAIIEEKILIPYFSRKEGGEL